MKFLHFLENIRIPVLNEFMLGITYLGDEIAFLVVALILFWCVDKRFAYYVLSIGFLGTLANQFLKLCFRISRPWIQDPELTVLGNAKEGAGGYSFPSGHSQSSVGTFGGIGYMTRNKIVRIICISVCILVPFSRMYIGVHTPQDVIVGSLMAIALVLIMRPLIFSKEGKYIPVVLAFMTVCAVAYLCYVSFYPFPEDVQVDNLYSGRKNAYTLLGALIGFLVVYSVDKKWLNFPVKAVWWAQILKVILGLAVVLAIKEGLSSPFKFLFGEFPGRLLRYFVVVIFAGIIWPLTFRWFSSLGNKEKA